MVAAITVMGVASKCNFFQRNFRPELILQAVGFNEDTVVFFFQDLNFLSNVMPMSSELAIIAINF